MGNPFTEESGDLLVLDIRELSDPAVHSTMRTLEKNVQEQYDTFVKERLVTWKNMIMIQLKQITYSVVH